MKAKLTLVYEIEMDNDDDKEDLQIAIDDNDEQFITEVFGIGWETPISREIEFT